MTKPITYSDAGVNIDAANRATEKIKELARATFNARTLSEIGSFGGMFDGAFPQMRAPVLVASADGVGTKLKIAFATNTHNTVGRDLVNHCTNDILVQGARPLFFLDYIATGKLAPETVAGIVEGIANGCRENGCVLLGGETAEMPGFYRRRRIRHRRLHRWHSRSRKDYRRKHDCAGRRRAWLAFGWSAHERLLAGAKTLL